MTARDWDGGILAPKECRSVHFEIPPQAWGVGEKEKSIRITTAHGFSHDILVRGKGLLPNQSALLDAEPAELRFTLSEHADSFMQEHEIELRATDKQVIQIRAKPEWLAVRLQTNQERTHAFVRIADRAIMTKELRSSPGYVVGEIRFSIDDAAPPVSVGVFVEQVCTAEIEPRRLKLSLAAKEAATVQLVSHSDTGEERPNRVLNVASKSAGLTVNILDPGGQANGVSISMNAQAVVGFHVVRCRIGKDQETPCERSVVVHIVP